mgnify:CR=1 FL=1
MINNKIPIISIIIPTYNHAKFIKKALQSVINQTFENWEAIVIDNYSTDDTEKILNEYKDTRIRYIKIKNNGIIAKSRNLGIENANGEWIAFLDSDDWWTLNKLETCFNNIDKKVDLIYHNLEVKYNKSKFNFENKFFKKKEFLKGRQLKKPILNDLLESGISKGNAIGNSSVIVRKNILRKIGGISENIKLVGSEDYNTWLRIAKITNQFKYLHKNLGYVLIHDNNTSKIDMSISQRQAVIEFMNSFNSSQKLNLEVKLKYISGNYDYLINNYNKAIEKFMFVLKNGKLHLKLRSLFKIILIMFKRI